VFTTLEGSLKPTVMLFGLLNSPAMFQTMINEILWNLINNREVVNFIDDVIVGTEEEKENNKIVEEVVRILAENDLYIKPEKYKWKVRDVGFLGVIIEKERIKMEQEKVKIVLDLPIIKEVKNVQKSLGLANYYRQFVEDFTFIARLLYDLVKKE